MIGGCKWCRRCIWSTYLIFVLVLAGCISRSGELPPVLHQQPCLSKEAPGSCFYGKDASSKRKNKLIVFVHGVFSTPADTWGDISSGNTWPHLAKSDERFSDFDFYLIKYHTTYFTTAQMIHEIAIREMEALKDSGDFTQYTDIYFITHSMGGLVVKNLLTHLNRGDDVDLLRRVKAVIFLGTPSQGASAAVLGNWLSRNPQVEQLKPAHLNPWLSDLETYWSQLIDDRKESQYPRAFCAYETRPYFLGHIVVPREAAVSKCDGPLVGLDFDHSDLAMATSKDKDPYKWVMDKINRTSSRKSDQEIDTTDQPVDVFERKIFFTCEQKALPNPIQSDLDVKGLAFYPKSPTDPVKLQPIGIPGQRNGWVRSNGYGTECQLINYGKEVVFDVQLSFGLRFKETDWINGVGGNFRFGLTKFSDGWTVPIGKLDTGPSGRFVFYVKNASKYWVFTSMPEFIEFQGLTDSKRRKVRLRLPMEWQQKSDPTQPKSTESDPSAPKLTENWIMTPVDWQSWDSKQ